ncbi:MAG: hypothetical protein Q4C67_11620, partial [Deinococcus sp.]|nr:hypothetical protein [Deinococcus sp.]
MPHGLGTHLRPWQLPLLPGQHVFRDADTRRSDGSGQSTLRQDLTAHSTNCEGDTAGHGGRHRATQCSCRRISHYVAGRFGSSLLTSDHSPSIHGSGDQATGECPR